MSILRPKSISFSAAQSGVSTSLQGKKATLQEFKEKSRNKIRLKQSLFFFGLVKGVHARETRRKSPGRRRRLSRHARVHFVSPAFHSTYRGKREWKLERDPSASETQTKRSLDSKHILSHFKILARRVTMMETREFIIDYELTVIFLE